MSIIITLIGIVGSVAGAASAYFWLSAARVKPVYNTAMLSGNREEEQRIDKMARLNALGACCAAVAVACQAILLAIQTIAPTCG